MGELDDEDMTALQDLLSKVKSKRISSIISAAIRAEAGGDEGMSGLSSDSASPLPLLCLSSASLASVAAQWETLYTRAAPFLLLASQGSLTSSQQPHCTLPYL